MTSRIFPDQPGDRPNVVVDISAYLKGMPAVPASAMTDPGRIGGPVEHNAVDQLGREIGRRITAAAARGDAQLAATLGEIGWNAYAASVGGVAFNGDPLPTWREIAKPEIKQAWCDAASAIARTLARLGVPVVDQPAAEPVRERVVIVWQDKGTALGSSGFRAEAIVAGRAYGATARTLIDAIAGLRGYVAADGHQLDALDFVLNPPVPDLDPNAALKIEP